MIVVRNVIQLCPIVCVAEPVQRACPDRIQRRLLQEQNLSTLIVKNNNHFLSNRYIHHHPQFVNISTVCHRVLFTFARDIQLSHSHIKEDERASHRMLDCRTCIAIIVLLWRSLSSWEASLEPICGMHRRALAMYNLQCTTIRDLRLHKLQTPVLSGPVWPMPHARLAVCICTFSP